MGCGGGAGAGWGDVNHLWKERAFGCVLLPSAGHVNNLLGSFQTWRIWRERWRRTEKPGVLQSMRSQRVGRDLATEQQIGPEVEGDRGRGRECSSKGPAFSGELPRAGS